MSSRRRSLPSASAIESPTCSTVVPLGSGGGGDAATSLAGAGAGEVSGAPGVVAAAPCVASCVASSGLASTEDSLGAAAVSAGGPGGALGGGAAQAARSRARRLGVALMGRNLLPLVFQGQPSTPPRGRRWLRTAVTLTLNLALSLQPSALS